MDDWIKKNVETTWMDLEDIMLSEISQKEKEKYCMILLIHKNSLYLPLFCCEYETALKAKLCFKMLSDSSPNISLITLNHMV